MFCFYNNFVHRHDAAQHTLTRTIFITRFASLADVDGDSDGYGDCDCDASSVCMETSTLLVMMPLGGCFINFFLIYDSLYLLYLLLLYLYLYLLYFVAPFIVTKKQLVSRDAASD